MIRIKDIGKCNPLIKVGVILQAFNENQEDKLKEIGFIHSDGREIDRSYYDLYEAIGDLYGNGNGETTFNIPDFTEHEKPVGNRIFDMYGS